MLKALAVEGDSGIYSEEYRLRHGLGAPSTVQTALNALKTKDLVESTAEGYVITNGFLSAWIKRYRHGTESVARTPRGR